MSLFIFGLGGLFSGHGWGESDFCTILFFTKLPLITSSMRWVASSMESITSSTWTPLGFESTCMRVLFTNFLLLFIGWVVRLIWMFYPTVLTIPSLLALTILVSSCRRSFKNPTLHPSASLWNIVLLLNRSILDQIFPEIDPNFPELIVCFFFKGLFLSVKGNLDSWVAVYYLGVGV